jgi:hypothetical protein
MPAHPDQQLGYRAWRQAALCCMLVMLHVFDYPIGNRANAANAGNVAASPPPMLAQANVPADIAEFQVKAAYLYKFGSYIEWPSSVFATAESPITIGVRGADAIANELIRIAIDHTINGHPVIVRKLGAGDGLTGINVLFVGNELREHTADILASAQNLPILIVTETEQALARGSMINFVLVEGRVRFEAAPKSARQNNLTISARLLAAAYRIAAEGQ